LTCIISLSFFYTILFLTLKIEFFAFIFFIVYVGAVAILFLFVTMMIDLSKKTAYLKKSKQLLLFYATAAVPVIVVFCALPKLTNWHERCRPGYLSAASARFDVFMLAKLYDQNFSLMFVLTLLLLGALMAALSLSVHNP
jgi:NADH-quinone oxidoreductase subunit J